MKRIQSHKKGYIRISPKIAELFDRFAIPVMAAGGGALLGSYVYMRLRQPHSDSILTLLGGLAATDKVATAIGIITASATIVYAILGFLSRADRTTEASSDIYLSPHSAIARVQQQIDILSSQLKEREGASVAGDQPPPDEDDRMIKLVDEVCKKVQEELAQSSIRQDHLRTIRQLHEASHARLYREIRELNQRARLNLAIGSFVTLLAATMLFYLVLSAPPAAVTALSLSAHYLPRLSIVIFTEVFAFFFLRLYKNALSDIRAYQVDLTELTNNATAVELALSSGSTQDQTPISTALIGTKPTPLGDTKEDEFGKADARFIADLALLIEKRIRKGNE